MFSDPEEGKTEGCFKTTSQNLVRETLYSGPEWRWAGGGNSYNETLFSLPFSVFIAAEWNTGCNIFPARSFLSFLCVNAFSQFL